MALNVNLAAEKLRRFTPLRPSPAVAMLVLAFALNGYLEAEVPVSVNTVNA